MIRFLFALLICCSFNSVLLAQAKSSIVFTYSCTPTSTTNYSYEITNDEIVLKTTEKIPAKREPKNRKARIRKVINTTYTYKLSEDERSTIDSLIRLNKLDSVGLYTERINDWGNHWNIIILKNSITYDIKLPNYGNPGLEILLNYILCLMPEKKHPRFECKKCG